MSKHSDWYTYKNGVAEIFHLVFLNEHWRSILAYIAEQHNPRHWVIDLTPECVYYLDTISSNAPHIFQLLTESATLMGNTWHFLSGAYDVQRDYALWLGRTGAPRLLEVCFMPLFFYRQRSRSVNEHPVVLDLPKRFYSTFNNRATHSRKSLLRYLASNAQLDYGYSTWRFTDAVWQSLRQQHQYLAQVQPTNIPYDDPDIVNHFDPDPMAKQLWTGGSDFITAIYKLTELEIVIETYDETEYPVPIRFITEKTTRPLIEGHPFICINSVHTQAMLTELGFVDYSKYIDYSFDSLGYSKQAQRIKLVAEEMMRLQQDNFTKTLLDEELAHNKNLAHQLGKINPVREYILNLY
jgi:hypothetical protein